MSFISSLCYFFRWNKYEFPAQFDYLFEWMCVFTLFTCVCIHCITYITNRKHNFQKRMKKLVIIIGIAYDVVNLHNARVCNEVRIRPKCSMHTN